MRRLQHLVVAGLVAAAGVLGAGLVLAPAATAAPGLSGVPAADTGSSSTVFTGTVATGQQTTTGKGRSVWTYTVNVRKVYRGDISTQRVQVRTVANIEPCRLTPLAAHGPTYAISARAAGTGYLVGQCDDLKVLTGSVQSALQQRFGEPRDPVSPSSPSSPQPVQVVSRSDAGPPSFTRLAAPGVALVLIGLLGVFLIRRTNRRR